MIMASESGQLGDLVERLGRGDPGALAELFQRFGAPLRRMVTCRLDSRLNGRLSASDILQEAYIDALKRVPHFRADMPVGAWLRWIVNQRLIDAHRQHLGAQIRSVAQEISIHPIALPSASSPRLAEHLVGPMTSPSQAAMRNEFVAHMDEALRCLEPLDREVLALRHLEELGNNEVADFLGIHKAAASKRYVRALGRLKEALERLPGFLDNAE
jgi:RNA polymerase sigma-70 factor (ECF subfamily)